MLQLQSAFGIFALLAIAFAISEKRAAVSWKQAAVGLLVTLVTAVVLLKVPYAAKAFASSMTASARSPTRRARARRSCSAMSAAVPCPSM